MMDVMKNLSLKIRKWISKSLKACSFTAMLFVFQACYGVSEDFGYDVHLSGTVKAKSTKLPIKGIKINLKEGDEFNYAITDENGKFNFYASTEFFRTYPRDTTLSSISYNHIPVIISDIDGNENGRFLNREIIINPRGQDEVIIHVELEEAVTDE